MHGTNSSRTTCTATFKYFILYNVVFICNALLVTSFAFIENVHIISVNQRRSQTSSDLVQQQQLRFEAVKKQTKVDPSVLSSSPSPSSSSSSSSSFRQQDARVLQWINGRRCIFIPSRKQRLLPNQIDTNSIPEYDKEKLQQEGETRNNMTPSFLSPPIVILGGMAQCIESWQHHFNDFSRERDIFMYEYLGSGLGPSQSPVPIEDSHTDDEFVNDPTSAYYKNVSLTYQAQELQDIIRQVVTHYNSNLHNEHNINNPVHTQVDIVAFSLGARIALATMAKYPHLIRKAHLTGIAAQRDTLGNMIFESWKDLLSVPENDDTSSNLRPFAWSLIMATHSKTCLEQNGLDKVRGWVDHICGNHYRMGLYNLLEQNRYCNPMDDAHDVARSCSSDIQIAVGSQDVISTPEQAKALKEALGCKTSIQIYDGCGHAVMNENPRQWRKDVLTFLNNT